VSLRWYFSLIHTLYTHCVTQVVLLTDTYCTHTVSLRWYCGREPTAVHAMNSYALDGKPTPLPAPTPAPSSATTATAGISSGGSSGSGSATSIGNGGEVDEDEDYDDDVDPETDEDRERRARKVRPPYYYHTNTMRKAVSFYTHNSHTDIVPVHTYHHTAFILNIMLY